jgi:hypothetical protein
MVVVRKLSDWHNVIASDSNVAEDNKEVFYDRLLSAVFNIMLITKSVILKTLEVFQRNY